MKSLNAWIALPLILNQWVPVPIGSQPLPQVESLGGGWRIQTQGNAGGWAFLLPQPIGPQAKLAWEWKVAQFPSAQTQFPFEKGSDDYAIRVGALLTNGSDEIRAPQAMKKLLQDHQVKLSYVVFYSATRSAPPTEKRCGLSPYSDQIVYCLIEVGPQVSKSQVQPIEEAIQAFKLPSTQRAKLKLLGLWLFADSDNTKSSSKAELSGLKVEAQ